MGYCEKILGNAPFGYAYHEVLINEHGCPVDYVFIDVNRSFEKMTGLLAKDVVNKKVSDVLPTIKNDPFDWIEVYGDIAINGGEKEFEQYSEPLLKWYQVQVSSPEKYYFATIFTDITSAKLLQQAKDDAQKQVYKSLESLSDGFLTIDEDSRVIHISPGAEEILGRKLSDILGKPLCDSSFGSSMSVFEMEYRGAVQNENANCFEAWLGNRGCEDCYEIRVIPNENGKGIYFHKITERKRWEQRLMKSEDVFNHCLDMFCVAGFDGYFAHINPAWNRILGWETEELLSQPWIHFVHPDDRAATENVKSKIINGQEVYQFENRYVCKDGSIKWLSWNSYPRPGEKVMFGVARDVTERKGVEDKLCISELKLTQQIEEYTAINEEMILANEELRTTTEDLMDSNQRINALLNALPDIIFVFNRRGEFLECHSGNIADINLPTFSIEKKNLFQMLPLQIAILFKRHIDQLFKTGEQQLFQYRLDGDEKIQDYDARMVQYDDDKALMVSRNITLQKQSEEQINLMLSILDHSQDFVGVADSRSNVLYVNPAGRLMLGLADDYDVKTLTIQEFYMPEDLTFLNEILLPTLKKTGRWTGELRFRHFKTAQPVALLFDVFHTLNPHNGEVSNMSVVSRDISIIKETENKLRQSEEVMRYIIKYDPNALAVFDNNMNYIATSDRFLADYQVKESDVLGKNHYDIFPDMPQKWIDVHQSALKGNVEKNDDDFFIRPDGSVVYTRWECRPWYLSTGSVGGTISYTEVITERKLAEIALQESEMTFRALFEKGPIGVAYHKMIYDASGEPLDYYFLDANKSYQNLTGVNPKGKMVTEAFPGIEKDPFNWIGTFGKVAKFGEEIRFQQYLESNNRWYDCVSYQYKPDHFVAAFMEITDQKMYEQALRENEIKYRMLFESNKDGLSIFRFDKDGLPTLFIEANESAGLMVGYTKEELLQQNILDFDIEYFPERLEKSKTDMMTKGFAEFETAIRHKLGHPIEVEVKAVQIQYNNEPAVLNITRDISERRKAEKAIRENEKKYRLLFEKSPVGIFHFDQAGAITDCNDMTIEILGTSKENIIGYDISQITNKEVLDLLNEALRDNTAQFEGLYSSVSNKKNTHLRLLCAPIFNENSELLGGIGIIEDRTAHIQKEEFEKQIAVAKEAVKFKQNFLANMSHEIRTPLTGIMGVIDLLSETGFNDERKGHFEILKNTSESLMEIVNQVLDFSKIEDGKLSLKYIDFNFREFLHQSIEFYGELCKERILISTTIDEFIPGFIKADKNRLTQVLNNLLSNAVKFTKKGTIKVDTVLIDLPKSYQSKLFTDEADICIKISVKDTGIGIDPEKQKGLFRPFVQVDDTETRAFEGTGLGLSISKQLVELHGGQIGIESTPGKGSTFWFTFLARSSNYNQLPEISDEVNNKIEIGNLRILLAEDKVINQKVISLLLAHMGYEVSIASNGQEALDKFMPGKFDLILMDIQMPVMDGITATRLLKERHSDLPPVVGLSANAFEGDREKYMGNGMDEYLTKPLRKEEFMEMLKKVL